MKLRRVVSGARNGLRDECGGRVAFAVELYFDHDTDQHIRTLWSKLGHQAKRTGEDTASPHVSLVVSDGNNTAPLRDDLAGLDWPLLRSLRFDALGYFEDPGVLYLAPNPSVPMLELQHQAYEVVERHNPGEVRPYYRPGAWMPHCTLAMPVAPAQLPGVAEVLGDGAEMIDARITAVGLWSFADHRPWRFDLDGASR